MKFTISAFAENKPGVLYRVTDLFLRRKINIESLTASETEKVGISKFTIVVDADANIVEKIVKQLYRIIEVIKVSENLDRDIVFREIALIKVHAKDLNSRQEIDHLTQLFKAKIIHVTKESLIVEIAGDEEEIIGLFNLLKPFGIKEFVRSGRISVLK